MKPEFLYDVRGGKWHNSTKVVRARCFTKYEWQKSGPNSGSSAVELEKDRRNQEDMKASGTSTFGLLQFRIQ